VKKTVSLWKSSSWQSDSHEFKQLADFIQMLLAASKFVMLAAVAVKPICLS
jgi:hypothetical protein